MKQTCLNCKLNKAGSRAQLPVDKLNDNDQSDKEMKKWKRKCFSKYWFWQEKWFQCPNWALISINQEIKWRTSGTALVIKTYKHILSFIVKYISRLGLSPSDPCSRDNVKAELTSSDIRRNIALIGSIPNNVIKQVEVEIQFFKSTYSVSFDKYQNIKELYHLIWQG